MENRKNKSIERYTAGSVWLLGEFENFKISEEIYNQIWNNLLLSVTYERDDLVFYHWETAHQFKANNLVYIMPDYDPNYDDNIPKNQKSIDEREKERSRFVEFHYALGGLLLYKKRYNLIKRIFDYTTSEPPRYELLPNTMDEIFSFYNKIRDSYEINYPWISTKYPFPEQEGIKSETIIKNWISSYMALLFLRQYTIVQYLTFMQPLNYPSMPEKQDEIRSWLEGIDFFKKEVNNHLENKTLMDALGFDVITKEWCKENNKLFPLDFLDILKNKLKNSYHQNAKNAKIDSEKEKQFKDKTKEIIVSTLNKFFEINNKMPFNNNSDKWFIRGQKMLQSKDAFSSDPETHHINFDTILATSLKKQIYESISATFYSKKTKTYILKPEIVFKGIDSLNINKDYIIINFGINLKYYINKLNIEGLSLDKYRGIKIFSFESNRLLNSSIFVVKKTDLPRLDTLEIEDSLIKKYKLDKLSEDYYLYASVINLNEASEEIIAENKKDLDEPELRKSVLLSIIVDLEVKWKKNINLIHISEYSIFRQKGLPTNLKEIVSLE